MQRPRSWRWLRRGAIVLALLGVLDFVVLPQVAGTRAAVELLHDARPGWAVVAVGLEAASLIGYSLLTRSVLPDARPSMWWLLRTDTVALGVGHLLPGGTAAATALRYRLLRRGGAPAGDTAVGMALQGALSVLVLAGLWWIALIGSIPFVGVHEAYLVTAGVGVVLAVLAGAVAVSSSRHPGVVTTALHHGARRLPRRFRPRLTAALDNGLRGLAHLLADRDDLRRSLVWAVANWTFDAASLWVFLLAFGHAVDPAGLLVAYGLANLLAMVPISPGGLGVVEAVLVSSLVGVGTPAASAAVGVIAWRLAEFWAPIPLAGLAYLSLRIRPGRPPRDGRTPVPGPSPLEPAPRADHAGISGSTSTALHLAGP